MSIIAWDRRPVNPPCEAGPTVAPALSINRGVHGVAPIRPGGPATSGHSA
jgi:hypothetical protein